MSQTDAPPARFRRFMFVLAIGALSLSAGTITALSGPVASSTLATPSAVRQSSGVMIELIEQDFTLNAGDELRLVYRLSGTLNASIDIAPESSTTTTTTTPHHDSFSDGPRRPGCIHHSSDALSHHRPGADHNRATATNVDRRRCKLRCDHRHQ